jgi:uncharacterized protein YceK
MRKFMVMALVCALAGCATVSRAEDKEKEEGNEEKVALASVPQAVQATLAKEAAGAKIDQVDKESEDGKTVYEVDVPINGKNYEIKVAEDGTLISKKLDEEDEKGEGKEKEEKDEKNEKK